MSRPSRDLPVDLPVPRAVGEPAATPRFMSVKQVSEYLQLNEKTVYALASEGRIPGTKVTGKWLFPRDLVDQWLVTSSHGGVFTDRLVLAGGDDALLHRLVSRLSEDMQGHALLSYSGTGTRVGLDLLASSRVDVCVVHWGLAEESHLRHPGLLRRYPQHRRWVLVRALRREAGIMLSPAVDTGPGGLSDLPLFALRWVFRQEGAGSQRMLRELTEGMGLDVARLDVTLLANSEREAAAALVMGAADLAPGTRAAAREFGLKFLPLGWEALDLAVSRGTYFRSLFQRLVEELRQAVAEDVAGHLGGYDLGQCGDLVWSA